MFLFEKFEFEYALLCASRKLSYIHTANQWVSSVVPGDKKVAMKGLGKALLYRRLSLPKTMWKSMI